MTKSEYANLMGLHTYSPVYDQKAELDADFVKTVKGIMEIVYKTELVRCKDCRYNYANMIPGGRGCQQNVYVETADDWYCADGERVDEVEK